MNNLKQELENAIEKVIQNNGQINNALTRFEITKTIERVLFQHFNSNHVFYNGEIKVVCDETNNSPESRNITITLHPQKFFKDLIDN